MRRRTIVNSVLSPRQESYLRLNFERATVEVTALYRYTTMNWWCSLPEKLEDTEPLRRWQAIENDISGTHAMQLNHCLDCMDRNERPLVSDPEARRIIELIAAYTSRP